MAKFTIYSKYGVAKLEVAPKYVGTYINVSYLEISQIQSPVAIDWEIGDYIDYSRVGMRFKLYTIPQPTKQARPGARGDSFVYSGVKFCAATQELDIAPFTDIVENDNEIHFSTAKEVATYEDVYGIARRIQACMDDIFPGKWEIKVWDFDDVIDADIIAKISEARDFSFGSGTCLGALNQIYDTWKNIGWIHTYDAAREKDIITIGRANVRDDDNTSDIMRYGKGNGLTKIVKQIANGEDMATRLYVFGSERNIPFKYYNSKDIKDKESVNIKNLMLPLDKWGTTDGKPDARKAYLEADAERVEKYGLIPKRVYFDGSGDEQDIYPSIERVTIGEIRQVKQTLSESDNIPSATIYPDNNERVDAVSDATNPTDDGTGENLQATFTVWIKQIGFNLNDVDALSGDGKAILSFKSGMCAGREFTVRKCEYESQTDRWKLTLDRQEDDTLGAFFPNKDYTIEEGDYFVILEIAMPEMYISIAQERLYEAGMDMLNGTSTMSPHYEPGVDAIYMKNPNTKPLLEGMYMRILDEDIITDKEDNTDYVLIDSITISENEGSIPTYKVTLREQKRSSKNFDAVTDMVDDAKKQSKDDVKRLKAYTIRSFQSAMGSIEMLQGLFEGFTEGITPATIQTMMMLVGDQSLRFTFIDSIQNPVKVEAPIFYDDADKQLRIDASAIMHYTLGITTMQPSLGGVANYMKWVFPAFESETLYDTSKRYYLYAKVSKSAQTGEFLLSETGIGMESVEGYYHLLVGLLNSEYDGERSFVPMYGFTEVSPGQVLTDVIRDGNGNLVIDLANAVIKAKDGARIEGNVTIGSGSSGLENLEEWSEKQGQIDAALRGLADLNNDTVLDISEKESIRREWIAINGISSTAEGSESGSYYLTKKHIEEIGMTQTESVVVMYGGSAVTYNGDAVLYEVPYTFLLDKAYENLRDYLNEVQINDTTTAYEGFDYSRLANLFKAYYDAELTLNNKAVKDVNSKADEAQSALTNMEYLTETFGKGNNLNVEGAVLSKMLAVADSEDVVKAGIKGDQLSGETVDATLGKLLLWAGSQGITPAQLAAAATRIYESGVIDTKKLIARDGCQIGSFVIYDGSAGGGGMLPRYYLFNELDYGDNGQYDRMYLLDRSLDMQYLENDVITKEVWLMNRFAASVLGPVMGVKHIGESSWPAIGGISVEVENTLSGGESIGLDISAKGDTPYAVRANYGMFAGLRPKMRYCNTATVELDNLDHTVFLASATVTRINLPSTDDAQAGQEYFLCFSATESSSTNAVLYSDTANIYNKSVSDTGVTSLSLKRTGVFYIVLRVNDVGDKAWVLWRLR